MIDMSNDISAIDIPHELVAWTMWVSQSRIWMPQSSFTAALSGG